jgi:hypothetical protein
VSDARPTGVIHDIGYRHYEGRRLGRGPAFAALMAHNLRGAFGLRRPFRAKLVPFLLGGVMLLPALVSIAVMAMFKERALPYHTFTALLQVIPAIFLAAQAPYLAALDLRYRILPLYLSRPILVTDYVGAKLAAMTLALYALIAVPLTAMFIGELVIDLPGPPDTHGYAAAMTTGLILAVFLAAAGLLVASVTPRRGLGVAAVAALYLLTSAVSLVLYGVLSATGHDDEARWALLINPFFLVDAMQTWLFGTEPVTGTGYPPGPITAMLFVACTALAIGGLVARYRSVASR